jgi:hypothetical protein
MASSGKKKTTMAKLNRESKLRERRLDKQARKDARKYAAAHPEEALTEMADESTTPDGEQPRQPDEGPPAAEPPAAKPAAAALADA